MHRDLAFIYDFMLVRGGAENLSLHVVRHWPDSTLVTGFIDRTVYPEDRIPASRCRSLTSPSRLPGWQGLKTMRAFDRKGAFLSEFETAVFSGVYAPVGVEHRRPGRNFYYCHTPPRFAYDLEAYYLDAAAGWQRPLLQRLAAHVRSRFETAVGRMDAIAVNSVNVRDRLRRYLGIADAEVIHPPVQTSCFRWLGQDDFFLSTARLEPYKRVDLIVKAFRAMPDRRLVVTSGGSEAGRLRRIADGCDNIKFTGWLSGTRLRELMGRCTATVYVPQDEDFGISPVESMAAGKPVIGVAQGGLKETVIHGETGILLPVAALDGGPGPATEAMSAAVERLQPEGAAAMRDACEARASRFDAAEFDRRFDAFIRRPSGPAAKS